MSLELGDFIPFIKIQGVNFTKDIHNYCDGKWFLFVCSKTMDSIIEYERHLLEYTSKFNIITVSPEKTNSNTKLNNKILYTIDNQLNIKNFDTGNITIASQGIVNLTNNLILRVNPGQTYTLNVQAGNISGSNVYTSSIHVWIDWDRNGTFVNSSERIAAENANNNMETLIIRQPNIISFTVPYNIQINTAS
jgi:hypothetical protein